MGWNRHAHPNEGSFLRLVSIPKAISYEVLAVRYAKRPLHLLKLHAEVVGGIDQKTGSGNWKHVLRATLQPRRAIPRQRRASAPRLSLDGTHG